MSFDHELILLGDEVTTTNGIGDVITTPQERAVLCERLSVTRSEHYAAAAQGLRPEEVFVINRYEYQGEEEAIFEGKRYKIIRAYESKNSKGIDDFENLELICEALANQSERYQQVSDSNDMVIADANNNILVVG